MTDQPLTPLSEPMKGISIRVFAPALGELKAVLRGFVARRALICCSPERLQRCDEPATGIFWQDGCEWYPCCDAHWPSGSQWCGNTQFRGGSVVVNCFEERLLPEERQNGEKYDRTYAA